MDKPNLMPFQDEPFNGDTKICEKFIELRDEYQIDVAVETGSCFYSTTEWLANNFERVFTTEINADFAKYGNHKIADKTNVHDFFLDSPLFLKEIIPVVSRYDKVIFFLDAHWLNACPLLDELSTIKDFELEFAPIIAIHDFYTGNPELGYDEYNGQRFDYEWIAPYVDAIGKSFDCQYRPVYNEEAAGAKRGIVYLIPE